jgi:hypothetical protein
MDTMIYMDSGLREDKNPGCISCIMIRWVENPLYPSFYMLRG